MCITMRHKLVMNYYPSLLTLDISPRVRNLNTSYISDLRTPLRLRPFCPLARHIRQLQPPFYRLPLTFAVSIMGNT